jgi:hypothetical protein
MISLEKTFLRIDPTTALRWAMRPLLSMPMRALHLRKPSKAYTKYRILEPDLGLGKVVSITETLRPSKERILLKEKVWEGLSAK